MYEKTNCGDNQSVQSVHVIADLIHETEALIENHAFCNATEFWKLAHFSISNRFNDTNYGDMNSNEIRQNTEAMGLELFALRVMVESQN